MRVHILIKSILLILVVIAAPSCSLKDVIKPAGITANAQPDFSKYIAIGDSQTSGQANDGLYRDAQVNSYPAIMAAQLTAVGGGNFYQPLFDIGQANGTGYLKLTGFNPDGSPVLARVTDQLAVRGTYNGLTLLAKNTGSISNFGVTGINLTDIADVNYGNKNPYYERLLPNAPPNNTTAYQDFVTARPYTFFSCWLGNNDVLSYATSGATSALPTDKAIFTQLYTALISKLTSGGQKGVLANIPDVSAIAYFNTVTVSTIAAKVKLTAPAANLYISARNSVTDTAHTARVATTNDLLMLNFDPAKIGHLVNTPAGPQPYGLTPASPIDNKYVLDVNEVALVQGYITAYNTTIKNVALAKGLALFDVYTNFNLLKQGGVLDGVTVSTAYITGGVASLDGVHLTPRGYAIEANEFIKAINAQYSTNIKTVNIAGYAGVLP